MHRELNEFQHGVELGLRSGSSRPTDVDRKVKAVAWAMMKFELDNPDLPKLVIRDALRGIGPVVVEVFELGDEYLVTIKVNQRRV